MIVATYNCSGVTVHVDDAALRELTPEQIAANRRSAQRLAGQLAVRAMQRGEIEGIEPEEYRRRYGAEPFEEGGRHADR